MGPEENKIQRNTENEWTGGLKGIDQTGPGRSAFECTAAPRIVGFEQTKSLKEKNVHRQLGLEGLEDRNMSTHWALENRYFEETSGPGKTGFTKQWGVDDQKLNKQ